MTQDYCLYDKDFYHLNEDECYFFSYSYLHIDLIAQRIGRNVKELPFHNGFIRNHTRIFCDNGTENSIASIGYLINHTVYGIIVKMKYSELEILDQYENGYSKIILPIYCLNNYKNINCNIYVKKSSKNIDKKLPSIHYLESIRKMLDNRRLYNNNLIYLPLNIYIFDSKIKNDLNDLDDEYIDDSRYVLIQRWK